MPNTGESGGARGRRMFRKSLIRDMSVAEMRVLVGDEGVKQYIDATRKINGKRPIYRKKTRTR